MFVFHKKHQLLSTIGSQESLYSLTVGSVKFPRDDRSLSVLLLPYQTPHLSTAEKSFNLRNGTNLGDQGA